MLTLTPLLPASDPVAWHLFPGGSLLVATVVASFASGFGIYLTAMRQGRWWALAGTLLALTTNSLALTTLQAIVLAR